MKLFHKIVQPRLYIYNVCSHSFVCLNFFTISMMMMAITMVMAMMIRRRRWCQNFLYNLRSYCTNLLLHDIAYHGWQGDTNIEQCIDHCRLNDLCIAGWLNLTKSASTRLGTICSSPCWSATPLKGFWSTPGMNYDDLPITYVYL